MMKDPVLGVLGPHPDLEGDLLARVQFDGRPIDLRVCLDGEELQSCLQLARDVVSSLEALQMKARVVAADELLESYNQNWRMFERSRDGYSEQVTNPPLSAGEFGRRLRLEGLAVTGSSLIEFCFSDDGLFAGHSVFVASLDGITFADTHASLFG